ncbi:MAG: hypothetical protein ABEH80_03320, partial [Halobaculum sp.]
MTGDVPSDDSTNSPAVRASAWCVPPSVSPRIERSPTAHADCSRSVVSPRSNPRRLSVLSGETLGDTRTG